MKQSVHRRPEFVFPDEPYTSKTAKRWSWSKPVRYITREQRLVFTLVGMAIATIFFLVQGDHVFNKLTPSSSSLSSYKLPSTTKHSSSYDSYGVKTANPGGKIPLGLKRKNLRILVTGGAGFVGSHLVDKLMKRGDSVIVVDNFFTGRKNNVKHHLGNPRFELIRHDVVEPILLEVDQIYHLACPASPVHYKFNPVKTIISFTNMNIFI